MDLGALTLALSSIKDQLKNDDIIEAKKCFEKLTSALNELKKLHERYYEGSSAPMQLIAQYEKIKQEITDALKE